MRKFLICCFLFCVINSFGQANDGKFHELPMAVINNRIDNIPTQNGKILYDEIIEVPGASAKDIFIKVRNWFVEEFLDSKSVLEVNDEANGLLTGKGTYKLDKINGLNSHNGYVMFVMNVKVKDGKFRYQLYSFVYKGFNKSFLADTYSRGIAEKVDLDDALKNYLAGSRVKKNRKFLTDMVNLQDFFDKSLRYNIKIKDDISDF